MEKKGESMSFLLPLLPALIAGLSGGASKFMQKDPKMEKLDTLNPGQQNFQDMILKLFSGQGGQMGGGLGFLQNLLSGSPESTKAFEAPLTREFNEQTVPGLAERFSGMGGGAQRSSAFGQALSSAGAGLTENIGKVRGGMQMQGLQQLMQLLGPAMQPSFAYNEKQQRSPWADILGGFGSGIAGGAGQMTPGLMKKYWGM